MNNKVMLVASFEEGAYSYIIDLALKDMGYEVMQFDPKYFFGLNYKPTEIGHEFDWRCMSFDPDYILTIKGRELPFEYLKDKPALKINWWLDNNTRYADFNKMIDVYDRYYLCEDGQDQPWLPIGIHPEIHKPITSDDELYKSDVVFAGTAHMSRGLKVVKILRDLPYKSKIFGNAWGAKGNFYGIYVHGEAIYWKELMKAYTMSHIILNCHYIEGITPNMRSIEAPASGSALLSDTGSGIQKCLKEGEEFISYKNIKEARYLICKYLEEPEELYRIGVNGYKRVRKDHDIHDRIKVLLK